MEGIEISAHSENENEWEEDSIDEDDEEEDDNNVNATNHLNSDEEEVSC